MSLGRGSDSAFREKVISFIDIGNRENPKILTNIALENSIFGPPTNVAVSGEIALVANPKSSIHTVKDLEGKHKVCQLLACKEEPIAFGLKALNIQVSMPEFMAGGTQPVEDILSKLPGVQRVEVGIVTRL